MTITKTKCECGFDLQYEWAVCDCSPCERSYFIVIDGQNVNISFCPKCGKNLNGYNYGLNGFANPIGYNRKDPNTYGYYCPICGSKMNDPALKIDPCSKCGYPKVNPITLNTKL